MTTNEIKKLLYKQNPVAEFQYIRKGNAYYNTSIELGEGDWRLVTFEIPISDMGDADFGSRMNAKLLIRWIMETVNEDNL